MFGKKTKAKSESNAHFIVTYGPVGTGKGFIKEQYIQYLSKAHPEIELTEDNTFIAEIDNLIEENNEYRKAAVIHLDKFFKQSFGGGIKHDKDLLEKVRQYLRSFAGNVDLTAKLEKLIIKLLDDLENTYFTTREPFNLIFDKALEQAIVDGENIIFETTGSSLSDPIGWLWKFYSSPLYQKMDKYVLTIVYPFVQDTTIEEQNVGRFMDRLANYYVSIKKASAELAKMNVKKVQELLAK
eukprot:15363312-Ditylum_brightwellii.AAC.1